MGCAMSSGEMPEIQAFPVSILDENEQIQGKGTLTVTTEEIQLQRAGSEEIGSWELRYLRRFGYDKKYFSFEAGRRCTAGQGIYAFQANKAAEVFKMVDYYINQSKQSKKTDKVDKVQYQGVDLQNNTSEGVVVSLPSKNYKNTAPENAAAAAAAESPKKKVPYADLDLSSKSNFKLGPKKGSAPARKKKSAYAEIDFEKTQELAGQ